MVKQSIGQLINQTIKIEITLIASLSININNQHSKTNNQMTHNPTFSLQNILNQPLSPDLCKRILDEIKSPLMEQSFALTNDESFSNSWTHHPKRPDMPPPSINNYQNSKYVRPTAINNKANTYSHGQGFYDQLGYNQYNNRSRQGAPHTTQDLRFAQGLTKRYQSQFITNDMGNEIQNNYQTSRVQIESVVSPLDPNITQNKPASNDFIDNIWSHFCGNAQNYGQEHEINYNDTKSKFPRKRIFDEKGKTVLGDRKTRKYTHNHVESILLINQQEKLSHISIENDNGNEPQVIAQKSESQVLQQLRRNRHFQVASFVGFLLNLTTKLQSAQKQRIFLEDNIEIVYQLASTKNPSFQSSKLDNQNCDKFFSRINCASVSQMIHKISRQKLLNTQKIDIKQYSLKKNQVSDSLQIMLDKFSEIQATIEQFVSESDSIARLNIVYLILQDKFTTRETKSTYQQIVNLLRDLRLRQYEGKVGYLEYLWDGFMADLLTETQFINGIVKTNGQYRSLIISHNDEDPFVSEISKMGYIKN